MIKNIIKKKINITLKSNKVYLLPCVKKRQTTIEKEEESYILPWNAFTLYTCNFFSSIFCTLTLVNECLAVCDSQLKMENDSLW